MHELAVCQALIDQVESIAVARNTDAVLAIHVQIGPLSGVEPALLYQAFSVARAGTIADAAELTLTAMPVRVRCQSCGSESEVLPSRLLCTRCGDWRTRVVCGDELLLTTVELASATGTARQAGAAH